MLCDQTNLGPEAIIVAVNEAEERNATGVFE